MLTFLFFYALFLKYRLHYPTSELKYKETEYSRIKYQRALHIVSVKYCATNPVSFNICSVLANLNQSLYLI